MKFWKMNGAGNDFLIIDNREGILPEGEKRAELIRTLCERHLSIGADGFMVVENSDVADYKMIFYNSDGSVGEMCGNGARCIARYGYEMGLAGETQKIETTAGIVIGQKIDKRRYKVRLNDPTYIDLNRKADIDGKLVDYDYVELGDPCIPHVAVKIHNLKDYPTEELFQLGRKLRFYKDLPKGANVNFYEIVGEDHVYERTYERGVEDFTYACGTGTGSVVTALTLKGLVSGKGVQVDMTGGTLVIDINKEGDKIKDLFLTGPTNIVVKGEATDEEL